MKRTLMVCLLGAAVAAGGANSSAQDAVVTIAPQQDVSSAATITPHTSGGYIGADHSGRHYHTNRRDGWRHMAQDRLHPRPVYAHSQAGARSTWTHNWNEQQAMMHPWHGGYYHYQYGTPLALVVPPTAAFQSNWSWGVGQTTSTPIYHQFARPYPGHATGGPHGLHRTPQWPSNTNQFGVYYIRGPW